MTRKQYEAKYGIAPVISSASDLDTSVAPVRMTRAEYDAKYGQKEEKAGLLTPAKEAVSNLGQTYANYPKKIAENVKAGTEDIKKGDVLKGVVKIGARTAGDIASTIFAPINVPLEAVGVNKLTDYLGTKLGTDVPLKNIIPLVSPFLGDTGNKSFSESVSDIPAIQNFAVTHPNAEEDFSRAMMLLFAGLEKGKIEPKTALPRTVEQIKLAGEKAKEIPVKIKEQRAVQATQKIEKEIANIEKNYTTIRQANEKLADGGEASRKRISQTDVLVDAVDKDGTIRTKQPGGAVEQYRKLTLDGSEGIVRDNLIREGKKINIAEVGKELTAKVYRSGLEGADLIKAIRGIKTELEGLALRADELGNIELSKIHDAKISTTNNINYQKDSTPTIKYRKAKALAYKELVENKSNVAVEVNGKKYGIKEINAELQKYYQDLERLEALDGKKVKGGKLGKYSAQIAGNIAGGAVGGTIGGLGGAAVGTIVGGETASFLKGKSMSKTFGEATGKDPIKNAILERAKEEGKLPAEVNLKIPDVKVGVPKGIQKTKEMLKVENDIAKNVEQQKTAIKAGDFTLVATLKEVYQVLVQYLKDLVKEIRKNPEGGFISDEPITGTGKGKQSQTQSPYDNSTTKGDVSQELLQEARKYKSAEEFVKIQGEPLYHGTTEGSAANIEKNGFVVTKSGMNSGNGISLTPNKAIADIFGENGKTIEAVLAPEAKLVNPREFIATKNAIGEKSGFDTATQKAIDYYKSKGFDGIDFRQGGGGIPDALKSEVRIWNPDVLKTKSQLTDIWNKANKK